MKAFATIALVAGFALLVTAPAQTAPPCGDAVVRDWADGRIDGRYAPRCYGDALNALPEDVRAYSTAEEDIGQALRARIRETRGPTSAAPGAGTATPTAHLASMPIPLVSGAAIALVLALAALVRLVGLRLRRGAAHAPSDASGGPVVTAHSIAKTLFAVAAACASLFAAAPAQAAPGIQYGVQDDAWLLYGPGSLDSRLGTLEHLGVDIVRFYLRWDQVAQRRPANARNHADPAYAWNGTDAVLQGLRRHRIEALVTLLGTPGWANGGRTFNWAPSDGRSFADFAYAAAKRYPWVRKWTIWNEPNQRRWLRPTTAQVYVSRLLNPGYAALHEATRGVRVAGGVTAPRAASDGVSPVAWIRGMAAARARLDVYAHHPYPVRPQTETPWTGACRHCATITMAELERLLGEVRRSFGSTRIWLTEYGYQTNPPDRTLGVPWATQARHHASASLRAYLAPRVDMLIHWLVVDETSQAGWQSGFFTTGGTRKPAYDAFRLPLTQAGRRGGNATLWGQIRPRSGRQPFRLRRSSGGRWSWIGGTRSTNARGFFTLTVQARAGSLVQVWSPRDRSYSPPLRVR
jgi:hypothetical protein